MSNIKISELTSGTPLDTDIIPYVDLVSGTTKKAIKSELKGDKGDKGDTGETGPQGPAGSVAEVATTFGTPLSDDKVPSEKLTKESLDGKQATLISGTNIKTVNSTTLLGAGDITVTVPVKASGSELDTGTDDAKFATSKALKDSHNVPSVAPGTSGNVLTSNGTDWTSAAPAGGGEWTQLANVVLGSAANSISSGTITAKQYIKVVLISPGTNSTAWLGMRFNGDTGNNYNYRQTVSSGSSIITTSTSNSANISFGREVDDKRWAAFDISNIQDQVKLFTGQYIQGDLVSELSNGYWNNTANQITSISVYCTESETFDAGTRMIVYGSKD